MPHPNLKSEFPVSPTLGGEASSLMDFINLPSPPPSEVTQDTNSITSGTTPIQDLENRTDGRLRATATLIPPAESNTKLPPLVRLAESTAVAERASIFGQTVVRGRNSVESLRKRLARVPSLDSLPENEMERGQLEIELVGMKEEDGNEMHGSMMLVIPDISRILEPLTLQELRVTTDVLHNGHGPLVNNIQESSEGHEVSPVGKIRNAVKRRGFEITRFTYNARTNKIGLSLRNKKDNSRHSSTPPPAQETGPEQETLDIPSSHTLTASEDQARRLSRPRLRNSITMTNIRAAAREAAVSTPLYPSLNRPLRPSASNGTLLQSRPTIRAVQPSPVLPESPTRLSPYKETDIMMRNTSPSRMDTPTRKHQGDKLTEQNLRNQERLKLMNLREDSEEEVLLHRTQALEKTLKFGKDLLEKIEKDNTDHRVDPVGQPSAARAPEASATGIMQPHSIAELTGGDDVENIEPELPAGFFRVPSRNGARSQQSNASIGRRSRVGHVSRNENSSRNGTNSQNEITNVRRPHMRDQPVIRPNLRQAMSLVDMRPKSRQSRTPAVSRPAVQPGLTPYRSFPALQGASNLVATRENTARTSADSSRRNGIPSRPNTAQGNKPKHPSTGPKKPPGGFGRDIKWA